MSTRLHQIRSSVVSSAQLRKAFEAYEAWRAVPKEDAVQEVRAFQILELRVLNWLDHVLIPYKPHK